uniref:Uncharacterized protein n=1 Tax=Arundo donax TaxID=35708 RepID=A0A0A8ZEX5_ARUDO
MHSPEYPMITRNFVGAFVQEGTELVS